MTEMRIGERAAGSRRTGSRTLMWTIVASIAWAPPAISGPPLISDDPHTVGPGHFQAILAAEFFDQSGSTLLGIPTVDLTLGVLDGLDLTLLGGAGTDAGQRIGRTLSYFEAGFKWQPLETSTWNAAFSPALTYVDGDGSGFGLILPVQVEWDHGPWAIGFDSGYLAYEGGPDLWRANGYASLQATTNWKLLAEVWSVGAVHVSEGDAAAGMGFVWVSPIDVELIGSAGTGLDSWGIDRVNWYAYVGIQYMFELW